MRRREIIFALLLAAVFLLAAGFFFFTSSFFLTRMVMPWIARSTGCPVSVERAEYRPFSNRLILYGFRWGREDTPFLTVRRARGTAQWRNLVRGIIDFDDVELSGAELNICRDVSGRWCQKELGFADEAAPAAAPAAAKMAAAPVPSIPAAEGVPAPVPAAASSTVQVRVSRCRVEDAHVNVIIRDRQRDMAWRFTGLSGEMDDFRNNGSMMINCVSPFRVTGRDGMDFAGKVEWNGVLILDEDLVFAGMRGGLVFDSLSGSIDKHGIGHSEVRCAVDVIRGRNGAWDFRNFRLVQQKLQQTGSWVEFSGTTPDAAGKFRLDFRRFLLSGQLLSLLMDMGCGVRPGGMLMDGRGTVSGDMDRLSADIACRIDRQAGPAYFGTKKVDLPDFQLQSEQNIYFDMKQSKAEVRQARMQVASGGRQILEVRKDSGHGRVTAKIHDFDLQLLQFLLPDAQRFGLAGGQVSGTLLAQLHPLAAKNISCHADLHFSGAAFQSGIWQPEAMDAVLSGDFVVPFSGETLHMESFQLGFQREKKEFFRISANGEVPFRQANGEVNWKAEGNLFPVLAMFRDPVIKEIHDTAVFFAPMRFAASGGLTLARQKCALHDFRLRLDGKKLSSLSLALQERDFASDSPWKIRWQAALPAELTGSMPWGTLSSGRFTGNGELEISVKVPTFSVHGETGWQDLSGVLYGKPFKNVSGGADLSFFRTPQGILRLNRSSLFWRVKGQPALRLECSGQGDPVSGAFSADVQTRYANEHLLNILIPGRFRSGQFSGRSRIRGDFRKMDWSVNGFFAVEDLRSSGAARAVDGRLQYEFKRSREGVEIPSCELRLDSRGRVIADLQMNVSAPADVEKPIRIRLSGAPLDLSSLYAHISNPVPPAAASESSLLPAAEPPSGSVHKTAEPAPAVSSPPRMELQTGPRAKEIQLDFRDMSWGSSQRFALSGNIMLQRNRLIAGKMALEGGQGRIGWEADGMDFPTGMMLVVRGKVEKPFALEPFMALFFPGTGLSGIVESGEWYLNFRRLFSAHWGEDLTGSCRLKFKDVELAVNAAGGPLSRLLLLPVETIVRADQLIPTTWDVRRHFEALWKHKFSAESPFSRLKFHSGEMQLAASGGELQIQRMVFAGEPLSQMEVGGKMELQAPYPLDFDSRVLLCGVQAKLPVRGVLNSPEVAAWQVFTQLPGQTLSGWFEIFSPSGTENRSTEIPLLSPFIQLIRDLAGFQE